MERVYVFFTALNSKGEYLKDRSSNVTKLILCEIDESEYATKSLDWLISNKIYIQNHVLPAILPLADIKFYKHMDVLGQEEGLLSLQDKIQGLGSTMGEPIVMVFPTEECNCE